MKLSLDDIEYPDYLGDPMTDDPDDPSEKTQPPHQPNTLRTWLPRAGAWLWNHPYVCSHAGAVLIGALIGYAVGHT